MSITQLTWRLVKFPFSIAWYIISLYLYALSKGFEIGRDLFYNHVMPRFNYLLNQSTPALIIKYFITLAQTIIQWLKIYTTTFIQNIKARFNRLINRIPRQQQFATMFAHAAADPIDLTQNQKVLLMMQKLKRLQQTIFQQSIDRRKAENQLFELKTQLQDKNSILIKEKSEGLEKINRLNILKLQLDQKNELIKSSNKHIESMKQQIAELKKQIKQITLSSSRSVKVENSASAQTEEQAQKEHQQEHTQSTQVKNEQENHCQNSQEHEDHKQNQNRNQCQQQNLVVVKKQLVSKKSKKRNKQVVGAH